MNKENELELVLEQCEEVVDRKIPLLVLAPEYTKILLDYIKQLHQENNQLKEKLNCDLKWALKYDDLFIEYQQLKEQRQELRSWLEAIKTMYENEYKDVDTAEHYNSVLSKLNELEDGNNE